MFTRRREEADEAEQREALAARVRGNRSAPACWACGSAASVGDVVASRTALNGQRIGFGACSGCAHAEALDREAAAALLDLPADDLALGNVKLARYADVLPTPTRPQAEAWGHIDLATLSTDVLDARASIAERTGGPCTACGMSILNEHCETSWSRVQGGVRCPSCVELLSGPDGHTAEAERAIAGAILAGITTATKIPLSSSIGRLVTFWSDLPESEREPGGVVPWKHMDIRALRVEVERLAAAGYIGRLPPRYRRDAQVVW